jgi:hypothetical protein
LRVIAPMSDDAAVAETKTPVEEPVKPTNDVVPDILAMEHDEDYEESDIFLWSNNLVQIKEELNIELFLFNKNNIVYKTTRNKDLEIHLHQLLIDPILEYVLEGADNGLIVRGFEEAEGEQNVLQRTRLKNVIKAREVLAWLKHQEHEIEHFVEEEHDLKRVKGVIARVTHATLKNPFYVVKQVPTSNVMKGNAGWLMRKGKFVPFDAEGALRIPAENHVLILEQDVYVFNQAKMESIFGYNAKKHAIAEKKVAAIESRFKLSFLEGQTLNTMVKEKPALINKLQKLDPELVKQEDLLDHAEEMGIELMTDADGAILIMDSKDISKFVTLLNDDYMESPMTGIRYEVKSKKPLKQKDGDEDLSMIPAA